MWKKCIDNCFILIYCQTLLLCISKWMKMFLFCFCCFVLLFSMFFFFRGVIYLQNMKKSDTIPISKLTLYFAEIAIYLHTLSPKSHNLQRFKSIKNIINAWWWRWNHIKHSLTDFCLSKRYSLEDEEIKTKNLMVIEVDC